MSGCKKALAIISEDPIVQKNINEIKKINHTLKQKLSWIGKQIDNANSEAQDQVAQYQDAMIDHFRDKDKLPEDYTKEKYIIWFDDDEGVLYLIDKDKHEQHNSRIMMVQLDPRNFT